MAITTARVGSEVEARCGRCHEVRLHVVASVEKDKPYRVQCRTCDADHLYHAPLDPKRVRSRRKPGQKAEVPPRYDHALEHASKQPVETYRMSSRYGIGQRLQHTTFGEGVVIKVLNPSVIEVVFREGARKLAIGR